MRLTALATEIAGARIEGTGDPDIAALVYDSRRAGPGALFAAVPGFKTDGHDYLRQALDAGAAAVLVQADHEAKWRPVLAERRAPAVAVPDARVALAQAAAALNGHPARRLNVIGVTGTDGKTSLAHLLSHVFTAADGLTGLVSTAECRIGPEPLPDTGRFTTPEVPELQSMLAAMVEAGCRWAVVEATSHGLALHRVDGCEYDIAVFTNLGADHMDFHGSREDYMAAKGLLFKMLDASLQKGVEKTAVLNLDDPACGYFRGLTRSRAVTYGLAPGADLRAERIEPAGWSSRFLLKTPAGDAEAVLPRPGAFNVYNALAAAAAGLAAGLDLPRIVDALATWPGAPGRTELIDEGQPFTVVVDFAHAPDSLRRVLALLRELTRGRVIAVFGCIGERDKSRRFAMGRVAAELADYTIVTDDNPYTEDRDAIIAEIAAGLLAAGKREGHDFAIVPDRRDAVSQALHMAVDEDAVLLAGKGHEREVHLAGSSYECDDREAARRVLRQIAGQ